MPPQLEIIPGHMREVLVFGAAMLDRLHMLTADERRIAFMTLEVAVCPPILIRRDA